MKKKLKIIISGGSGYLGGLITQKFKDHKLFILTRDKDEEFSDNITPLIWDGKNVGDWQKELEGADVLINLAGKNINARPTEENKQAILKSRIQSTEALGKAVEACENPPKMWLNASAVAIYPETYMGNKATEKTATNGKDFLSKVSRAWEIAFERYGNEKTKKVVFRISLVLGDHEGSAYQVLKKLVQFGGGGKAGSGEQVVSWIGEHDFVDALAFIIENELEGAFNFCNPEPITNAELMKQLRNKLNIPIGLPAPEFLVKIGTKIIGTNPNLVLRSQNVYPQRLLDKGFEFKQTKISDI